ncbi:CBS domain-containing protein [Nocardia otitidiscaviarum]|nr:CBS domain-containing protein [Nocardia otitidiscaviarum]MCP9619936.1 CBS domain-containing protein [Nocardia otitidiscaviarum]
MARAWTVRGGWDGHREETALAEGLAIAGWSEVHPDLSPAESIDQLRTILERCYPTERRRTVDNWTHQLWRFVREMEVGDFVVMPRKYQPVVAIGRIVGEYEHRPEARPGFMHVRKVEWLTAVERAAIGADLRDSMGAFLTISELSRRDAAARIQELADTGIDPGYSGAVTPPADIDELLDDIRESGTRQLSARDLIGLWGHSRRTTDAVEAVNQELRELGITTDPDFTAVQLDDTVTVSAVENAEPSSAADSEQEANTNRGSRDHDLTWRVGNLRRTEPVIAIRRNESLARAAEIMAAREFSQLPIVDENRCLLGVITWESIAHSQLRPGGVTLWEARADKWPPAAHVEEELFTRVPDIQKFGYVIVVDNANVVTRIITASDLAGELRTRVTPFTVLEEIERRLRIAFGKVASADLGMCFENNKKKAQSITSPSHLTMGNYPHLVAKEKIWNQLGWPFEQGSWVERLTAVAEYRNQIAHWNVDAPESERNQLAEAEELLNLLKIVTRHTTP